MFGENAGQNAENSLKNTANHKASDTPFYGMIFESSDPHLESQINTHFTTIAAYLEKQVCHITFICCLGRIFCLIAYEGWYANSDAVDDSL